VSEPAPGSTIVGAEAGGPAPAARSVLRSVAVPAEHGGWGLTLEPALLGLLVAPSAAGACLAVAALLGFVARTPVRLVLVDLGRRRRLPRTRLALVVAAIEVVGILGLVAGAVVATGHPFWWPALLAAPLIATELWFDSRSRSRRLVPELAGAVGISAVAAMVVLAGGGAATVAAGAWLVLAARIATSIPYVRSRILQLHGRPPRPGVLLVGDVVAIGLAAVAVGLDRAFVAGAVAIVAVVGYQRLTAHRPVRRVAVLGIHQMLLGFGVVLVTAVGVLAS